MIYTNFHAQLRYVIRVNILERQTQRYDKNVFFLYNLLSHCSQYDGMTKMILCCSVHTHTSAGREICQFRGVQGCAQRSTFLHSNTFTPLSNFFKPNGQSMACDVLGEYNVPNFVLEFILDAVLQKITISNYENG